MHPSCCVAILAALALAAPRAAAQQGAEPSRLALGRYVVDGQTGAVVAEIVPDGERPCGTLLSSATSAYGTVTVDAAVGEVLTTTPQRVTLSSFDRKPIWSVERAAAHVDRSVADRQRWLAGDRVVLPREGGGLVALDRATGAIAWERAEAPQAQFVVDADLVVAAGAVGGKPHVAAFSLANGARGFAVPFAEPVRWIAAGALGVAVVTDTGFTVLDRSGPELFTRNERPIAVVAGGDAWFTATRDGLTAWSRSGEKQWTAEESVVDFQEIALAPTADGGVVQVRFVRMADSGFQAVRLRANGEVGWRRNEPGLGVGHSKYWHRVEPHVRDGRLFVASQGAAGSFVVELDPTTGERLSRATPRNP